MFISSSKNKFTLLYPYETSSAAEWLQEALQKSCKSAGLQQSQILDAVESPLTAIKQRFCSGAENSRITICAAKWLQSGFEKTKNVVSGNDLPLVSTKKGLQ